MTLPVDPHTSVPSASTPMAQSDRARQKIQAWMDSHHATQQWLADHIDKPQYWVSRYLAGETDADLDTLERLAAAFGTTLTALIDIPGLSPEDRDVITLYRALAPEQREAIRRVLEGLTTLRLRRPSSE